MTEQTLLLIIYFAFVGLAWYSTSQFESLKDMPQARWLSFVFVMPAMAVAVGEWGIPGLLVGILGLAIVYGGLSLLNSGNNSNNGGEEHLRGARLLDARDKNFLLKKKKEAEKTHGRIFTTVGGVCITKKNEARNILMVGAQGSGKSQVFHEVYESVSKRKEKAIIFDESGDFITKHGRDNDLIFSLNDRRSLGWSWMNDIRRIEDCATVAKAAIPNGKTLQQEEWNRYARQVFQVILEKVFEAGGGSNKIIYDIGMFADTKKLKELCLKTVGQRAFEDGNEKMVASILTVLASNLACLKDIPDGDFSIRNYIQDEKYKSTHLYLVTDSNRLEASAPAYRAMLNLAITYANSLPADDDRRIWFFLDELPALESLDGLSSLLNRGRKRGATAVVGIQSVAFFDDMFGRDKTPLLMNGFATVVIMRAGDEPSAKAAAAQLGSHDVMRAVQSESEGSSGTGSSQNKSINHTVVADVKLVTPSELTTLPDLQGYLRRSGDDYPVLLVNIPICYKKGNQVAYVEPPSEQEISDEEDRQQAVEDERWRIENEKSKALEREKVLAEQQKLHLKEQGKEHKLETGVALAAAASQMLTPDFDRSIADILEFEEQQQKPIIIGQTVHAEHHKEVTHEIIIEREIDHQSSIDQDDSHGGTYTDNSSES